MEYPTRYALLRDRRYWTGATLAGLEADIDGALSLLRIPGPADGVPIDLPPPFDLEPSGLAVGPCKALFIADTEHHRIIFKDGLCSVTASIPGDGATRPGGVPQAGGGLGQFDTPRGLAVGAGALWVADSHNARVQTFLFPALEMHGVIAQGLQEPVGVALDGKDRLYVLDRAAGAVVRFTLQGMPDAAFNTQIPGELAVIGYGAGQFAPAFFCVAEDDTLYLSERSRNTVLRFDAQGHLLGVLTPPSPAWQPRALVVRGRWLYAFDAAEGRILVLDRETGSWLATVAGYRGPVSALAVDPVDGTFYIKPGLDDHYLTFAADVAVAPLGTLLAGPFDAGESLEWFRAAVEADAPAGTAVGLEVFQNDVPTVVPAANDWQAAPSLDTLLKDLIAPTLVPFLRRYLWMRVTVTSPNGALTPTLRQVRAETPGEDYLEYLPATYHKHDALTGFLARLLELCRAEVGGSEEKIADVARTFTSAFTPAGALPWLAEWLAFELPDGLSVDERRALVPRVFERYERRGTPASLRDFVELYSGVGPAIAEAFRERAIWQLAGDDQPAGTGALSSRLGFDTVLPPVDPNGIIVADPPRPPESEIPDCRPAIGSSVVGEGAPLPITEVGEPLFAETAHRFTVIIPAARIGEPGVQATVQRIIEQEKPAHTGYHLCMVDAKMRVGFQARIGVDAIVADGCKLGALEGAALDLDFVVGGALKGPGRVGARTHIGRTTVLG